ncbi:MAG: phenylacetate--CoA ligase family protein, partial [Candidatus Sungbacteria bacterium]|nr:phenylacetate--CoA ligase family protein [Candidatus Sungbacteria bacterium]
MNSIPDLELKILEYLPERLLKYRRLFFFKKFYKLAFSASFYDSLYKSRGLTVKSVNSMPDISKVPIVSKRDFKILPIENYLSRNIPQRIYYKKTSGSTGEPAEFIRDKKYLPHVKAFYYLTYRWLGVPLDSKRVCLKSPDGSARFWESADTFYVNFKELQKDVAKHIRLIKEFNPLVIESHPSYLAFLGHYLKDHKIKLDIPFIVSYGEELLDSERHFLKEIFNAEVSNFYGLNEVANLGTECERHDGFHVNELSCLVEIVDGNGRAILNEDEGEIIVTSFINEIMPLVRYRTGDRGRWILSPCPCGRNWPRLRLLGRRNDTLKLKDGRKIFSFFFNEIFNKYARELKQYQVIQKTGNEFLVKIAPSSLFAKNTEDSLLKSLKLLLGDKVKILISKTDFIDWTKSG